MYCQRQRKKAFDTPSDQQVSIKRHRRNILLPTIQGRRKRRKILGNGGIFHEEINEEMTQQLRQEEEEEVRSDSTRQTQPTNEQQQDGYIEHPETTDKG